MNNKWQKIFPRNIKWHLTETGRENKEVLWLPTSVLKSTLKRGEGGVGDGVAIGRVDDTRGVFCVWYCAHCSGFRLSCSS